MTTPKRRSALTWHAWSAPEKDFGYVMTKECGLLYFHRNSVLSGECVNFFGQFIGRFAVVLLIGLLHLLSKFL
jgi:hypothetical protein